MIYDLQKASILKRISAFLLDFILLVILATGFAALIAVIVDFGGKLEEMTKLDEQCCVEFGVDQLLELKEDERPSMMDIGEKRYNELPTEDKAKVDAAWKAYTDRSKEIKGLTGNGIYKDYEMLLWLTFTMISLGFFFATLILEFVLPLVFKHGRTVGKRLFAVGVMQISGVRIKPVALFVRSMLGKYAIETMVPFTLVLLFFLASGGLWSALALLAILILQLVLVIVTKTNSLIHDIISSTVTVDMQTQMIFDSIDEMMEYKQEVARQEAELAEYK